MQQCHMHRTGTDSYIAHLWQQGHNSKRVIFQERLLKALKCHNFLLVQRQQNCSPAASFANCVMTLYLLKVHLRMFPSIPITQRCQIFSCATLVANEWYMGLKCVTFLIWTTDRERGGVWVGPESRCLLHHISP